jgi:hypothetical protein
MAVFADQGIGKKYELAHDSSQSQLGGFTGGAQPAVEGLQVRVAAAGGDGCHGERIADKRPFAFDMPLAAHCARIVIHGCGAGERGELCAGQHAEFRQARHKRRGGDRADAFNRGEKLKPVSQAGVFGKKRFDGCPDTFSR